MPRFDPRIQSTVVFLYRDDPRTDDKRDVMGSGVLIGKNHPNYAPQQQFSGDIIAVTAAHVVRAGGSIIRINTKDGKSRFIELDPSEWTFGDPDDVAAVNITDMINEGDDVAAIHETWLADSDVIKYHQINIGDDGMALGLFSDLSGEERNIITGRFGNVSLMADVKAPIEYNQQIRPAHLFDMKSRPGLSGAPIFVYRTPTSDLRLIDQGPPRPHTDSVNSGAMALWSNRENTFLKLLGIHSAQYTDEVKVTFDTELKCGARQSIRDGDFIRIPNSMSVVVPAEAVKVLLNKLPSDSSIYDDTDGENAASELQKMIERTLYSGWRVWRL